MEMSGCKKGIKKHITQFKGGGGGGAGCVLKSHSVRGF